MNDFEYGLRWGIKASFINYVKSLDDGELVASEGATLEDGRVFHFPVASVDGFDAATGLGTVTFSGRADVSGHFGMMSVTVDAPVLQFAESGVSLMVPDPDREPGNLVAIADLGQLAPTTTTGTTMRVDAAPATLAPEGVPMFNRQYLAGDAMDAVSFAFSAADAPGRANPDPNLRLMLQVADRVEEAEDVISLSLVDPTGAPLPEWAPGSHIDIHLGDGLVRQYSLSSLTTDQERWRITVLREDQGVVSTSLHGGFAVGSPVEVSLPRNNFALVPSPRYIFVAGGIGITPLVPMIEAAERSGSSWTLVYSGRSRSRMAFVDELASHGDRARVTATATEPRLDFAEYFAVPQADTLIYACGPENMLVALEEATGAWPIDSLHTERFVPREFDDSGDVEFEVEFVESGVTVTVPVGRTILALAEEHDIPVISSCSEGTCGTCETPVLEGVPDHRDSILTDGERAANTTMFICVSRSVAGCKLRLNI